MRLPTTCVKAQFEKIKMKYILETESDSDSRYAWETILFSLFTKWH